MKIVADEGVDGPIVARLREDGHEVDYVAEIEPGISDDRVLSLANERQALLITTDNDFGELVVRQGRLNAGVLLLRLPGVSPSQKAARDEYSRVEASSVGRRTRGALVTMGKRKLAPYLCL